MLGGGTSSHKIISIQKCCLKWKRRGEGDDLENIEINCKGGTNESEKEEAEDLSLVLSKHAYKTHYLPSNLSRKNS
ncbi:hypothetical protein [Mycoplasma wenyonii]|uniref:hypothetical protein n=1 Tax=Mycoplasma wenyonii TaxID=65123 RepID=UPI0002D436C2|nr:hypothetical protein [Mycoplasma wenyonii]